MVIAAGLFFGSIRIMALNDTLVVYPDSYHTLLWDNDSSQVFNDIASWIKGK